MKRIASLTAVAMAFSVTGCSVLEETKVDYKTAQRAQPLEVPPDLSRLKSDSRYQLPGQSVSANQVLSGSEQASGLPTAAQQFGEIKLERAGNQRWLLVSRSADQVWDPVAEFWKANGFTLSVNRPDIGIMETEWAENRAKLPMDFVREGLGKLLGSLYSTGELDKFRTRMERNADGSTEIYISHKGMIEVYARERDDFTQWQPRASDPELENEFLRRMMIALGTSQANAQAALPKGSVAAASNAAAKAVVQTVDGVPSLLLQDTADRAWRRVGLALDRSGFTVEERDRKAMTYTVRYVPSVAPGQEEKPGFFARLFSSKKSTNSGPIQLKVTITAADSNRMMVRAIDDKGQPSSSAQAGEMLRLLAADLQ